MAVLKCGISVPVPCYTAYRPIILAALSASALEPMESSLLAVNKGTHILYYQFIHCYRNKVYFKLITSILLCPY